MKQSKLHSNFPQILEKIQMRSNQLCNKLQTLPASQRSEPKFLISSILNNIELLKKESNTIMEVNRKYQFEVNKYSQRICQLEQYCLTLKEELNSTVTRLQSKNCKLISEIEFLKFKNQELKEELEKSKSIGMVKDKKHVKKENANELMKDIRQSMKDKFELFDQKLGSETKRHKAQTVDDKRKDKAGNRRAEKHQEEQKKDEKLKHKPKQRQRCAVWNGEERYQEIYQQRPQTCRQAPYDTNKHEDQLNNQWHGEFNGEPTHPKKPKKVEMKLSKILKDQAKRAQYQQMNAYIETRLA